jgi:microcystin degradation protein MlrC
MRILIAECKQEVSTFNPAATHYEDFVTQWGDDVLAFHGGLKSEVGGAMSVFQAAGAHMIGAYSAKAITSGGTLAAADWDRIAGEFLTAIREAPPVDAIFFSMHGAMCAANEVDPEGYLLTETRKIVGEAMPIVVSLDLHGIVTNRMLEAVDAAVGYHTYPHNDFFETGERAGNLLLRIARGEVKPVTAICRVPALVRGDELITATGKIGARIREAQAIEAGPGGLSAAMFWGNPFTDVPDLCSHSLVVTDGDAEWASREAVKMSEGFWLDRAAMQAELFSPEDAIRMANGRPARWF